MAGIESESEGLTLESEITYELTELTGDGYVIELSGESPIEEEVDGVKFSGELTERGEIRGNPANPLLFEMTYEVEMDASADGDSFTTAVSFGGQEVKGLLAIGIDQDDVDGIEDRNLVEVELSVNGRRVTVIGSHITTDDNEEAQGLQLDRVREAAANAAGAVVVAADADVDPDDTADEDDDPAPGAAALERFEQDGFEPAGPDGVPTFENDDDRQIDHVLVNRAQVVNAAVVDGGESDHDFVVADIGARTDLRRPAQAPDRAPAGDWPRATVGRIPPASRHRATGRRSGKMPSGDQ